MGLALSSNNQTLFYIGLGVGAIFLITMGGAHHIIVALVSLAVFWLVGIQNVLKLPENQGILVGFLVAGALFIIFVLHGRETSGGEEGYPMDMASLGLPMRY